MFIKSDLPNTTQYVNVDHIKTVSVHENAPDDWQVRATLTDDTVFNFAAMLPTEDDAISLLNSLMESQTMIETEDYRD